MRSLMARQSTRAGRGCARRNVGRTLEAMRGTPRLILFTLAAVCWLAAGPGGATLQGTLACRHHATHQSHPGHGGAPADGPRFCGEMAGSADLALSAAGAAPLPAAPSSAVPGQVLIEPAPLPPPP